LGNIVVDGSIWVYTKSLRKMYTHYNGQYNCLNKCRK
jgi:hypothetical protein